MAKEREKNQNAPSLGKGNGREKQEKKSGGRTYLNSLEEDLALGRHIEAGVKPDEKKNESNRIQNSN